MNSNRVDNIAVEHARILFRNFAGKADKYNRDGKRSFCLVIENPDVAQQLLEDGWNVRILAPKREGDLPLHYIQVEIRFDVLPPKVMVKTRTGLKPLTEETISSLDYAEIRNLDVIVRPRVWDVNGKTGIKAYLKTMYITLEEDVFEAKYAAEEYPGEDAFIGM